MSKIDEFDGQSLRCPNCGSRQVYVGEKGFSVKRAAVGGLLLGGIGLLAGLTGSKNVRITCLDCGHKFTVDEANASANKWNKIDIERQKRLESLTDAQKDAYIAFGGDVEEKSDIAGCIGAIIFIVSMITIAMILI